MRAERYARERLQGLEGEFPCASWLPVIVQNPAVIPPAWADLWQLPPEPLPTPNRSPHLWRSLLTIMATSAVVTGVVMGVRSLGWLQALEFPIYDQMMRLKDAEPQDKRLLVVTIDNADIAYQQQQGWKKRWSLSDEALALLMKRLEQFEPRAIGLDVERSDFVDSAQPDLSKRLKNDDRLYAACFVRVPGDTHSGILPPPEVPVKRQGFSNIIVDSDGIVRRHLLFMDSFPTSPCTAPGALSTQLAARFLRDEGIKLQFTPQKNLKLGSVEFKSLHASDSGYQSIGGSQILLNYRSYKQSSQEFVDTVTLTDVLTNKIKPDTVKNRVILVGVITSTTNDGDRFRTPYSTNWSSYQAMPGVLLHAQMVSQIISAVLGERPLLLLLPQWSEWLWVWGWSVIGGILVLYLRPTGTSSNKDKARVRLMIAEVITLGVLCGLCYILFTKVGYWIALVPSGLAIVSTGCCVSVLQRRATKESLHNLLAG